MKLLKLASILATVTLANHSLLHGSLAAPLNAVAPAPGGPIMEHGELPYLADFHPANYGVKGKVPIEGSYTVLLRPDHDLKAHWEHIGTDLSQRDDVKEFTYISRFDMYMYELEYLELLQKIRTDPQVMVVEQHESIDPQLPDFEPTPGHHPGYKAPNPHHNFDAERGSPNGPPHNRQLWTRKGEWYHDMITAGGKVTEPLSSREHRYEYLVLDPAGY
jgi:hypothetical protein